SCCHRSQHRKTAEDFANYCCLMRVLKLATDYWRDSAGRVRASCLVLLTVFIAVGSMLAVNLVHSRDGGPDARTTDEASRSHDSGAPQRRCQVRRRVGAGDPDEVSRGQFLQAPGRRNLRLRPRGRIEDDADLDERTAGARAQAGYGSTTTIGHSRRVLL